jgi:TatD DNase family protein
VLATVALHLNTAPRLSDLDGALAEIRNWRSWTGYGVGETGLDYYRTSGPGLAAQERSFPRASPSPRPSASR